MCRETIASPVDGPSFVSLTPGLRTRLGGNLFLLVGAEFPVENIDDYFSISG